MLETQLNLIFNEIVLLSGYTNDKINITMKPLLNQNC